MVTKVTKTQVKNDFDKLKKYATECYSEDDFSQALCAIETASKLMYTFNIVYTDDEMEKMLCDIAFKVLEEEKNISIQTSDKKIIFYDYFAIDGRGLTQQYINALIELEYEILFITYDDLKTKKSERIFLKLSQYKNARVYIIKNKDNIKAAKELRKVIDEFGASRALLHTAPWDVVGILTWSTFKDIERYLINLTDHAFWLGKCCSDFILEFRSYGYNISRNFRHVPEAKLIFLPYYPIQDNEIPFEGLPFDAKGKKIVFSGGALYKISGSTIFFDTIKYIVANHDDAIVLYAGGGDRKPFEDFIINNNLHTRVYLIAERKDITHIFKNCYFYLGTYPLAGGLMSQLAVANKKIPVVFAEPSLKCNFVESFFININDLTLTHVNLEEYYKTIDRLFNDSDYKYSVEEQLTELIVSPKDFTTNLETALRDKTTEFSFVIEDINAAAITDVYFEMENANLLNYYAVFFSTRNVRLLLHFKKYLLFGSWSVAKRKILNVIKGIMSKMKKKLHIAHN